MGIENLEQLNNAVDQFSKGFLPRRIVRLQKVISIQVLGGVIDKTPVDEGVARGGWQLGVDNVPSGQIDRLDESVSVEESAAFSDGLNGLSALTRLGQTVFIVNNVRYIIYLEEGRPGPGSTQAPNGMVAVTIQEVLEQFG